MLLVATEDFANGRQNLAIVKFIEQLGSSRCWALVAWWSMRGCYMHSSCSSSHLQCGRWSCEVLRCSLFIVHCSFCAVRWSCSLCDIHCSLFVEVVFCALCDEVVLCAMKLCVVCYSLFVEVVRCALIVSSQRHFPLSFLRRQWEGCRYLVTEPEISNLLGGSPKPSTHTHHRKFFCKHFIDCKPPQAPHPHEAGQNFSLRTFYQWQATPQLVGHKPSTQTPIHKSSPPCKTTSLQTLYCG